MNVTQLNFGHLPKNSMTPFYFGYSGSILQINMFMLFLPTLLSERSIFSFFSTPLTFGSKDDHLWVGGVWGGGGWLVVVKNKGSVLTMHSCLYQPTHS